MPYLSEKIKIENTEHDKRVRLLPEQKEEIRKLYEQGFGSTRTLAKQFNVSKKTITLIVNDEARENARKYNKEHWRQYQKTKEEHARVIREYRRRKQALHIAGEI